MSLTPGLLAFEQSHRHKCKGNVRWRAFISIPCCHLPLLPRHYHSLTATKPTISKFCTYVKSHSSVSSPLEKRKFPQRSRESTSCPGLQRANPIFSGDHFLQYSFFIGAELHFLTDVKLETEEVIKAEQCQLENAKDQESSGHLNLLEISGATMIYIKLEDLDYRAEVPETHLKCEIDDFKLENMEQRIMKDEVEMDHNM